MPIMPEMPDLSKVALRNLLSEKCNLVANYGKCPGDDQLSCNICALGSVDNYKEWQSQRQKKKPERVLIKWPMLDKELFFIMPRVSMNAMPHSWKKQIIKLLNYFVAHDFNKVFTFNERYQYRNLVVRVTENGRFVKMPDVFKKFDK